MSRVVEWSEGGGDSGVLGGGSYWTCLDDVGMGWGVFSFGYVGGTGFRRGREEGVV